VVTNAHGAATFSVDAAETAVSFQMGTLRTRDVIAAHVHCAARGVNGPVGVTLYSGPPVRNLRLEGVITTSDPGNGCAWADLADWIEAMREGNAYVNVHTQSNPAGLIRGQIGVRLLPVTDD